MEKYRDNSPDFVIKAGNTISDVFLQNGINTFYNAAQFVKNLPYRRNTDKNNLSTVFMDHCGTCGTKHALLYTLAGENNINGFELVLCLFKMNAANTPKVREALEKHNLFYIPEMHTYLKYGGEVLDYTFPDKNPDLRADLLQETTIEPRQITDFKVALHKKYITEWIVNENISYTPEKLWEIREMCIHALAGVV